MGQQNTKPIPNSIQTNRRFSRADKRTSAQAYGLLRRITTSEAAAGSTGLSEALKRGPEKMHVSVSAYTRVHADHGHNHRAISRISDLRLKSYDRSLVGTGISHSANPKPSYSTRSQSTRKRTP